MTTKSNQPKPNFYYNYDLKDSNGMVIFQFIYVADILGSTYGILARLEDYDKSKKTMRATFVSENIGGIYKYAIAYVDETVALMADGRHQIQVLLKPLSSNDVKNSVTLKFDKSFNIDKDLINVTISDKDILGLDENNTHDSIINLDDRRSCNTKNGNG